MSRPAGREPLETLSVPELVAVGQAPPQVVSLVVFHVAQVHAHARRQQLTDRLCLAAALIVCLAVLVAATLLILRGHEVAGTVVGTCDLVGVAAVFLKGRVGFRGRRGG